MLLLISQTWAQPFGTVEPRLPAVAPKLIAQPSFPTNVPKLKTRPDFLADASKLKTEPSSTAEVHLVRLVHKIALQHNIDPKLFEAIIRQESSFKVNAINLRSQDYGLGQINIRNIRSLGLDKHRLTTDPTYNLTHSALILQRIQRLYAHEDQWWCRYNVGYGSLSSKRIKRCMHYAAMVKRYMPPNQLVTLRD